MVDVAAQVLVGDVRHAARLISEIENGRQGVRDVLRDLSPRCGSAQLVGITGPPGAGKSSLVAALIRELRTRGRTVGVVAVDPSSPFSGGALLGDRDRMLDAAGRDSGVFIRSLAARGASGGLAAAVNDAVDVMDAMGKDVVVIETVGVGQGELDVAMIAHTVVLVLVPGYGDFLQAMKAGITEIADVVVVNKADNPGADQTVQDLHSQDFHQRHPGGGAPWPVPVLKTSALRSEGISELVDALDEHAAVIAADDWKSIKEQERRHAQFVSYVTDRLRRELSSADAGNGATTDPYGAAERFVAALLQQFTNSDGVSA